MSQQKCVLNLLNEIGQTRCKPTETPIETNHKLSEATKDELVDRGMYQRLIRRLIYLSHTHYIAFFGT